MIKQKTFIVYYDYNLTYELDTAYDEKAVVEIDSDIDIDAQIAEGHRLNGFHRKTFPAFKIVTGEDIVFTKPLTNLIRIPELIKTDKECETNRTIFIKKMKILKQYNHTLTI